MTQILSFHVFMLLGGFVSYEDWRLRKIRNRWIIVGLSFCVAATAWLAARSIAGYAGLRWAPLEGFYLPWTYYQRLVLHLALSLGAAVAFWRFSVWPAGDAKLFLLYCFFLPLIQPNLPGFPRMLFFVVLINVFVPAGAAFAVETILSGLSELASVCRRFVPRLFDPMALRRWYEAAASTASQRTRDHWPYRYDLLALGVNLSALFIAFRLAQGGLFRLASGPAGRLIVYAALILGWGKAARLLRNRLLGAVALCALSVSSLAGAFLWHADLLEWAARGLMMTFNFGLLLSLSEAVLSAAARRQSLATLAVSDVEPGLILDEATWRTLQAEPGLVHALGRRYCDGLSGEEATALKSWLGSAEKPALAAHRVYRGIPFAVWIFIGALLTFRCRVTALHSAIPLAEMLWRAVRHAVPWWSL